MTLGFIIPLKSKAVSYNWNLEVLLLERTLKSVCKQINQDFEVYVVHNEKPEVEFIDQKVKFAKFPYHSLKFEDISDYNEYGGKYYDPVFAVGIMDKIRKVAYGCKLAKECGCKYLMVVDSDDLVSSKLVAYIKQVASSDQPGWYINKGYIYKEGSSILVKQFKNMHFLNGSTNIVRQDLFIVPDFNSHAMWDYSFFESHGYLVNRIKDYYNEQMKSIPFPASVYVVHKNNWSGIGSLTKIDNLKKIVKQIIFLQLLSNSIKEEFGLYHLNL